MFSLFKKEKKQSVENISNDIEENPLEKEENNIVIKDIKNENGIITIFLNGRIDAKNSIEVKQTSIDIIEKAEEIKGVYFNMQDVNYITSTGFRMFLDISKVALEKEIPYKLIETSPEIHQLFNITGYSSAFSIEEKE